MEFSLATRTAHSSEIECILVCSIVGSHGETLLQQLIIFCEAVFVRAAVVGEKLGIVCPVRPYDWVVRILVVAWASSCAD